MDVFVSGTLVLVSDLGAAGWQARWPGFAVAGTEAGATAMFAFPLAQGAIRSVGWGWRRRWRCCGRTRSPTTGRWMRWRRRWWTGSSGWISMEPAIQPIETDRCSRDDAGQSYG